MLEKDTFYTKFVVLDEIYKFLALYLASLHVLQVEYCKEDFIYNTVNTQISSTTTVISTAHRSNKIGGTQAQAPVAGPTVADELTVGAIN